MTPGKVTNPKAELRRRPQTTGAAGTGNICFSDPLLPGQLIPFDRNACTRRRTEWRVPRFTPFRLRALELHSRRTGTLHHQAHRVVRVWQKVEDEKYLFDGQVCRLPAALAYSPHFDEPDWAFYEAEARSVRWLFTLRILAVWDLGHCFCYSFRRLMLL